VACSRRVAQLASSWVRSTRNFKPAVEESRALILTERRPEVSWACGPRLEASRATPRVLRILVYSRRPGYQCRDAPSNDSTPPRFGHVDRGTVRRSRCPVSGDRTRCIHQRALGGFRLGVGKLQLDGVLGPRWVRGRDHHSFGARLLCAHPTRGKRGTDCIGRRLVAGVASLSKFCGLIGRTALPAALRGGSLVRSAAHSRTPRTFAKRRLTGLAGWPGRGGFERPGRRATRGKSADSITASLPLVILSPSLVAFRELSFLRYSGIHSTTSILAVVEWIILLASPISGGESPDRTSPHLCHWKPRHDAPRP